MQALIPQVDPEVVKQCVEQGIPLVNPQAAIAARVWDNNHLREFIQALDGVHRMKVYEAIVPHLSFKAKPYWWLMSKKPRRKHAS